MDCAFLWPSGITCVCCIIVWRKGDIDSCKLRWPRPFGIIYRTGQPTGMSCDNLFRHLPQTNKLGITFILNKKKGKRNRDNTTSKCNCQERDFRGAGDT